MSNTRNRLKCYRQSAEFATFHWGRSLRYKQVNRESFSILLFSSTPRKAPLNPHFSPYLSLPIDRNYNLTEKLFGFAGLAALAYAFRRKLDALKAKPSLTNETITARFIAAIPTITSVLNLEVAVATQTETFTQTSSRKVFWGLLDLGDSTVQIRVPVTYRYHIALRYGDLKSAPIGRDYLLQPRRREDGNNDLWSTYNRVQENLLRGGLKDYSRRKPDGTRYPRMRAVAGLDETVRLNKALWQLVENIGISNN